ncbi:MAG: hypothetical protein AB1428_11745 [Bacteroidota bacterium]
MGWRARIVCGVWAGGMVAGVMTAHAQVADQSPPPPQVPDLLRFISPLLLPKLVQDGYRLKEYIRSEEFSVERARRGDREAVDAIFDTGFRLAWENAYEALLITFVAVMDHRTFGIKIPLLGDVVWLPLTSEFTDDFTARVNALPSHLFPDSPPGRAGDRDKLQHFFGSAFLTYVTESPDAAERMGAFVEWGERAFIVDGAYDQRDLLANRQGQKFARALLEHHSARPSDYLGATIERPTMPRDSIAVPRADSLHVLLEAP